MKSQLEGFSPSVEGSLLPPLPNTEPSAGRVHSRAGSWGQARLSQRLGGGSLRCSCSHCPRGALLASAEARGPCGPQITRPVQGGPLTTGLGQDQARNTPETSRQGQRVPASSLLPPAPRQMQGPGVGHPVQTLPSRTPHHPAQLVKPGGVGRRCLGEEAVSSRAPRERRKDRKEAPSEERPRPRGQRLPEGEGAQTDWTRDARDDAAAEHGASLGKRGSRRDARGIDWKLPAPLGPVYPPLVSSLSSGKALGRTWELSPSTADRFRIHDVHAAHLPQQGPFQNFMDMKAEKRLTGRKERRSRFGDINTYKCYQFGQIFCPFQALATTEMRRLVFPRDLPLSPHMQSLGISCPTEGSLQDLPLSSTELGLGRDASSQEKEKPSSHVKTPLLPPIVKATKSSDKK
ncbi:uncharacterized protein LOC129538694 [Moschus berezovskii]|uniref:uncharacterized protein LOC129538694 n=1 Tax=Moschus berezovskii TaxID=68408 RepID=UPI002443928A|nr:uncharacterized protein LOC129538694 [Moschus berezovskii]